MKKRNSDVVAVIDVGTNYLRMSIASIFDSGMIEILEEVFQPTTIGRDTFADGRISFETIKDTCGVVVGFSKLMKDYKVKKYRAFATSGIREADNRDYIIEQIRLVSGINVEIINNVQERYYIYKALRNRSSVLQDMNFHDSIIVNISSGGVEASIYDATGLKFTEYFKLGPLRLREILCDLENKTINFGKVMEEYIESKIFALKSKIKDIHISEFIGLGGDLGMILALYDISDNAFIENEKIEKLYEKLISMNTDQIAKHFGITNSAAELLMPAVLIFHSFLRLTNAKGIYAPMVSLRQGMLYDMADEMFNLPRKNMALNDIISSVWYIAEKYGVEKKHAEYIEKMALEIFDRTWKWHRLGDHEKRYLQVAAILHDTGNYVSFSEHGMHSYNIIRTQNIMGFSDREMELIANIARYHTSKIPTYSDSNYTVLRHKEKIIVSKLSAILKLAESMDSSHLQKISRIETSAQDDVLLIKLYGEGNKDILLEKWDIMNNVGFFQEAMGIKIKLKG